MIEQIVRMLHRTELGLDEPLSAVDIADIIWLAAHLHSKQQPIESTNTITSQVAIGDSQKQKQQENQQQINFNQNQNSQENLETESVEGTIQQEEVSVITYKNVDTGKGATIPFSVPAAAAIPNQRAISRALRSLNQKVSSPTIKILDQAKTITQSAEEEFCFPVLKPALQRWLDVVLIVETSPSYGIWQKTIKELQNLLLLQGTFRDVKCWYANFDNDDRLDFRSQQGSRRSPKELINLNSDRIILILSDCVSLAWYGESWSKWIKYWGKYHPVSVLQMLPPSFWSRTALGQMDSVWLSSQNSGVINQRWKQESATPWEEATPEGFPLPVVTLEPYALEVWAKGIAGTSSSELTGVYLQALESPPKYVSSSTTPEKAEQLFEQFMQTASPTARRLAALLSAVPLQLPIVRLVQHSLLATDSSAVHVAEIFLSGIVKKIEDDPNPEKRLYDFESGLREKFNRTLPKQEIVSVIDRISIYIARRLGVSLDEFRAMLFIPASKLESPLAKEIGEFARISKTVLQGLGQEYAEFVANLATDYVYSDDLGVLLKKFSYNVATVQIKLEFKVVTIVPKEQISNRPKPEDIYFREEHFSNSSPTRNRYQSYQELSNNEQEGRDYRIRYRQGNSDVAIVAHHGGKIQTGSTEIADAIAGEDYAFYSFEGLKDEDAFFIPSHKFDESRALDIVSKANRVITIHGFFEQSEVVYLGGLDDQLKKQIKQSLGKAGFTSDANTNFEGTDPNNICNRGQAGNGVQIGISWGLRKKLFDSLKSESNELTLWDRFIQAIRDALSPLEAAGWRYQYSIGQADYYTEDLGHGVELEMISIPGGSFIMGAPEDEVASSNNERPRDEVIVPSFFMGRYPITQEQWLIVAGWKQVEKKLDSDPSFFKEDYDGIDRWTRPVEGISWEDAKEFYARLSLKTGKEYRLPSEAEWEYACRAGTDTPFHFGETISADLANYNANYTYGEGITGEYREQTTPVGYFKVANNFGLCDMHGNVWEWCEDDWHENYQGAPTDGKAWLSPKSSLKVIRGGSWLYNPLVCRSAFRDLNHREDRGYSLGFRVVCVARAQE